MSRQYTQEILDENGEHAPSGTPLGKWLSEIFSRGKKMTDEAMGGPTTTPVEEAQAEVEELHSKEFMKKLTFKTLKDIWTIYTNPAEMLSIGGIWKLTGGQYQLWLRAKKEVIEKLKDKYATSFTTESHRLWEQGGKKDDLSLPKNKLGDYKRFLQLMGLSVHTPTESAPEEPILQFVETALEDARQFDEQAQNIRARFEDGELDETQVAEESQELFNAMRTNQVAHVEQVAKAAEQELPEKKPETTFEPVAVAASVVTETSNEESSELPEPVLEEEKQTLLQSVQPTNVLSSMSNTTEEVVISKIKENPPTVSIAEVYRQFCIRIVSHKMQMLGEIVTFNFSGEATEIKDPKENVIQRIKKASVEELQTKGPIDFINEALNTTIDPDPQINQYADLFHTLLLQDEFQAFTFNQQSYSALQEFLKTKSPEGEIGDNATLGVQRQVARYVIQHTLDELFGTVGPGDMRVDKDHDQFLNAILLAFEKKLSR